MNPNEQYYNSIFKRVSKLFCLTLFVCLIFPHLVFSQSCECTDCPDMAAAATVTDFEFLIGGATNNDLSAPGQGVCAVVVEFIPDHIWSLEMVLTSPGGQQVTLIGPSVGVFGFTGPFIWDITFLPCGEAVMPDAGFSPVWDNDQPWALGAFYSGSYYPNAGCLEDFNTGSVNGIWTLSVNNTSPVNTAQIFDFSVVFCDDAGLNCFVCEADAGGFQDTSAIVACTGDPALVLDLEPEFSGNDPDPFVYDYTYIISQNDVILSYETQPDLTGLGGGVYKINGFSYRNIDSVDIPPPDGNVTLTSLNQNLIDFNSFFCGDITDTCLTVTIIEVDTSFLAETLCAGDTFLFGIDTVFIATDTIINVNDTIFIAADTIVTVIDTLTTSGIFTFDFESAAGCDSTVVLDLNIQDPILTILNDTICAEDTYLFNGVFYESSGEYTAVFSAENLCDSTVVLNLFVKDSIITYLTETICSGETYTVGNSEYALTGVTTDVLNSAENCDSTVILDLTVLDPSIVIAPPEVLNCVDSTVVLDASASTGEALVFEWSHLDNGNDGIVSGENAAIAVINKTGNYLLVVTDTLGGNICEVSTTVSVEEDVTLPHIVAEGGIIDCDNDSIQLTGFSNTQDAVFLWTGPNSFSTNQPNPTVGQAGDYTLTVSGLNGCEAEMTVSIVTDTIPPVLALTVSDTLDCNITTVQLFADALPEALGYSWTGPNTFSSAQQNPFVSAPGVYIMIANTPNGCTSETSITVEQNLETPDASATGDTLSCTALEVQLQGNSTTPGATFSWTGPNSFNSDLQNPLATEAGEYFLTVQGTNGCETTVSTFVEENVDSPDVTAFGDTLDCVTLAVQIFGNSTTPDVTYSWEGPNNFSSDEQSPTVDEAGNYTLTVQAANGCQSQTTAIVEIDTLAPELLLSVDDTLDCNTFVVQLFANAPPAAITYSWEGPNSFNSDEQNPEATEPGEYILTAIAPNGCAGEAFINVVENLETPSAIALGDTLDCNSPIGILTAIPSAAGLSYNWSGPNSFSSEEQNPEVSEPGEYYLTVEGSTGCGFTTSTTVTQDFEIPDVSALGDTLDCNNLQVQLQGNSTTLGVSYAWAGPNNFSSELQNPEVSVAGEYILTVQSENGCEAMDSVMVVADGDFPDATAIGDTLDCNSLQVQLQGNSTTLGVSYAWEGPNSFSSDLQSPEVSVAGEYILTVQAENGCATTASAMVYLDNETPDVIALGDTLDCNNSMVQLTGNSTNPDVTYAWIGPNNFISNLQNPNVTLPGEYILTVQAENGCEAMDSATVVQDAGVPDIFAEVSDTLDCNTFVVELQGSSATPEVTYVWTGPNSFETDEPNSEATDPGEYTLTVTSPNGCQAVINVAVHQNAAFPDATALGDTLDCNNPVAQLQGNSNTPDVTYSWTGPNSFNSDEQNPEVLEIGEYFLTVQTPNGCSTTTSAIVDEGFEMPVATAVGDTLTCDNPQVQLQGNSTILDVTYSWTGPNSFSSDEQNPEVSEAGEYILTVSTASECTSQASVFVVADVGIPDVLATTDTISCSNPVAQLQGNSNTPDVTYSWTGPNSFSSDEQNPEVSEAGEYILTVSALNTCSAEMTITVVDISEQIFAVLNTSDTVTCEHPLAEISAEGSTIGAAIDYLWLNSENDSIGNNLLQTVDSGGLYTLIVSNSFTGCTSSSVIFIEENTTAPTAEVDPVGAQSINCQNNSVVLNGEDSGPIGEVVFEWFLNENFLSNAIEIEVMEAGEYSLQVTNLTNGCSAADTIIVDENMDFPQIEILPPADLNCLDTVIQLDATNSSTGNNFEYLWTSASGAGIQSGAFSLTPFIDQPGEYILTIENTANGCSDSAIVLVNSNTEIPIAEAGEGQDLDCENPTVFLNGNGSSAGAVFDYLWTGTGILSGDSSLNPEVNQTGVFTLLVTNADNGCAASDQVVVGGSIDFVNSAFVVLTNPDCFDENNGIIEIESVVGGDAPYLYAIDNQGFVQNNVFYGLTAGDYQLSVMDANGCEWDTLVSLDFPTNIFVDLGEDMEIALGDSINLDPQVNVPFAQLDTFFWQQDDAVFCDTCFNPWVKPYETSRYSITVANEFGCTATDEIVIRVKRNRLVYIPNAFSPDGDGTNDNFKIYGGGDVFKINSLKIYNRWGAVVFEDKNFQPDDTQQGWDGTYRSKKLNPDVFVYYAEIVFINGRIEVYKGDVTLFR